LVCFPFIILVLTGAQVPIAIRANSAALDFPYSLTFKLEAQGSTKIDRVVLLYGKSGRSCHPDAARQEIDFTAQQSVSLSWQWDFGTSEGMPAGTEIWWQWQIHDSSGVSLTTEKKTVKMEDSNFAWMWNQKGPVTALWAEGDKDFGLYLLNQANLSLNRLTKDMGITAPAAIWLIDYPTADDVRFAIPQLPTWVGGVAFPDQEPASCSTWMSPCWSSRSRMQTN
jgi:hypothetical protein